MAPASADARIYQLQARVLAAAAHPISLAIIDFLKDGERCVCDIARHVDANRSNVSRHLGLMLRAGLVDCRKEGLRQMYRLRAPCVVNFLACVNKVLRHELARTQAALARL